MAGLGFVAKPGREVAYRPDGGVIERPSKPIVPSVANPCAIPIDLSLAVPHRSCHRVTWTPIAVTPLEPPDMAADS